MLEEFFAPRGYREHGFVNGMAYELKELQGLLASTSYAPPAGTAGHAPLMQALATLFAATSVDGRVAMQYRTRLFCSA